MVPDFGALADGDSATLLADLAPITELGLPVKVILEMGRLEPAALALLVEVSLDAGARFLKSGSGFGPAVSAAQVRQLAELARGPLDASRLVLEAVSESGRDNTTALLIEVA